VDCIAAPGVIEVLPEAFEPEPTRLVKKTNG